MNKWECTSCGNQLESELEPQQCPCGNEDIEAQQQLSMLEQMMKDYLGKGKDKKAKS